MINESEDYEGLLQQLSDAEHSGNRQTVIDVCSRALETSSVQSAPEKVFKFGIKYSALLLADDEYVNPHDAEKGVDVMREMLRFISLENGPRMWANVHIQLGATLFYRIQPYDNKNAQSALEHYENALLVLTSKRFPKEWALVKVGAAEAYWRIGGSRNREVAISYLREALTVYTREEFPDEHKDYSEQLLSWERMENGKP